MKRTPLSIGSSIRAKGSSSYTYIIDDMIGDGASSIVYKAHYIDNSYGRHNVRLKECYPYASDIQRIGSELVWEDATAAINDKVAFTTSYHKLLDFQNINKIRNSTAHIFDLCEANGTLYSVMDENEGQTFEQDNCANLLDILKTTLALTRVIEKYHNNGYLHLDIKPSNFLIIPETRELVILFDVDTVTSIEDIKSGKVKCVSYSRGWAAPEQIQGHISKLCPATDIYSIGALLFQKVMGRSVENEDIGIFADWEFDGEMFDNVNPKIKRLLREIFHKTLAANVNRRYHSVCELIAVLEDAVMCSAQSLYLQSQLPFSMTNFVGRKNELDTIQDLFAQGKHAIFLCGMGGIGKTELAIQYGLRNQQNYDVVIYMHYQKSLRDSLFDIEIENFFSEAFNEHWRILRRCINTQKVLFIVDNIDKDTCSDPLFSELLSLDCDFLFTTRFHFSSVFINNDKLHELLIEELNDYDQINLFLIESGLINNPQADVSIIKDILHYISGYTLLVSLMAKQYKRGILSLLDLRNLYSNSKLKSDLDIEIKHFKDGSLLNGNIYSILNNVLRMNDFDDKEKLVMRSMTVLNQANVTKSFFIELLGNEYTNVTNNLIDCGWIFEERNSTHSRIYLHDVVASLCKEELNVWYEKIPWINTLFDRILSLTQELPDRDSMEYGIAEHFEKLILSIYSNFSFSDEKSFTIEYRSLTSNMLHWLLTEGTLKDINLFYKSIIHSDCFEQINSEEQARICVDAVNYLWKGFVLDSDKKMIAMEELVDYYRFHLDTIREYATIAEDKTALLHATKRTDFLKEIIEPIIEAAEWDSIYAISYHVKISKEEIENNSHMVSEIEKICENHIEYIKQLPYRIYSFEEYPDDGMPHNLRCTLETYNISSTIESITKITEQIPFSDFIEEEILLNDDQLDKELLYKKDSLKDQYGWIFGKPVSLDTFEKQITKLIALKDVDYCEDFDDYEYDVYDVDSLATYE